MYEGDLLYTNQFLGDARRDTVIKQERYNKPRTAVVTVDSRDRNKELYPDPNHYKITFNRELINVRSIRLISSEFPNTAQTVYSGITNLYWISLEDTTTVYYNAILDPGNYTAPELIDHITSRMNSVNRYSDNTPHEFIVTLSTESNIIQFQSIKSTFLPTNPISLTAGSRVITVNHPGHTFRTGDFVVIVASTDVGSVSQSVINTTHEIIFVTTSGYQIVISSVSPENISGGGSAVKAGVNKPFMFMNSNTDIPMQLLGFPQQDSASALEYPIEYISATPPDLDVPVTIPRVTNQYTGPAWLKTTGHTLQVGDRVKIRNTDTIPSINGVMIVTDVPDATADDLNYFSVGKTTTSGTVVKVVNKQSVYTNTNLGYAVESFDITMRYISAIAEQINSYITAASPHNLTNISNVYIAYTDTSPNITGINGVSSIVFSPPDPLKFSIDTSILGVLSTNLRQEFVKVTQASSNAITKIYRKNNGILTLGSAVTFDAKSPLGVTPFLVYIGLPADPLKTSWAVPDLNSYNVGLLSVLFTNFPGTTEAFSDSSIIELTTEIIDITGAPGSREIVIVDSGTTSIIAITSIQVANTGYIGIPVPLNTIAFAVYPALNNIYVVHTPIINGYHNDAQENIYDVAYPNGSTFSLINSATIPSPPVLTQQESFVYSTGSYGDVSGVYITNNGLIRDVGMNTAAVVAGIITFDASTITHSAGTSLNGGILYVNKMFPVSGAGYPDSFDTLSSIDDPLGELVISDISPFSLTESTVTLLVIHEFYVGQTVFIHSNAYAPVNNQYHTITSATVGTLTFRINVAVPALSAGGSVRALGRYTVPQKSGISPDPGVNGTYAPVFQIERVLPGYTRMTTVFPNTTAGLSVGNAIYIRDVPAIANGIRGIHFIVNVFSPTQFDLSTDLGGAFPVTPGGSTVYIKLASGVTSFYIPTSITMAYSNIIAIDSHNFPVSPAPFVGNLLLSGINTNPVSAINDPLYGMPFVFSSVMNPNTPHTIRIPAELEVIDRDTIRLLPGRPNVINAFTSADPNFSTGTAVYAITNDTYVYPIISIAQGTTGILTTSTPHLLSINDKVYIEGPSTVTVPSGGIQGIHLVTSVVSGTEFQIDRTITQASSPTGKLVKIDPTQTTPTSITRAERRTSGTIETSIDLNLSVPPGGGFGYPAQFDVYIANANVVTEPAFPAPGLAFPGGGSLKNITFTANRVYTSYYGNSSNTFEPGITLTITNNTTAGSPVTVTTSVAHNVLPGDNVYITGNDNILPGLYSVSGTPNAFDITMPTAFAVANTGQLGFVITQRGGVDPFYISSVPSIPAWVNNVAFANSSVLTQPIKITSITPNSAGTIELDSTLGIVPLDNVYIEGTGFIDGIGTVSNVIPPNQIELSTASITTPGTLRSAIIDISYSSSTGTVIFDISHSPSVTFLVGEPVSVSGHSISNYNVFAFTVAKTDPGKTIELTGLVYTGNGTGGVVTANFYGRLIRTPSSSVHSISNITQGVAPAVYTSVAHDFSGNILYIFDTMTTPDQNGLHTNAVIINSDTFSLPDAVTVSNSSIILQNRNSAYTKQALRTTVGYINSVTVEPTRTVITTNSIKNPNTIAYKIERSVEGNPCTFYVPGHTFLTGASVTIVNHKSKPVLSGSYTIINVVLGVSFQIAVTLILGSPLVSGCAVSAAPDYPGHTLRSLSGSLAAAPYNIVKIYHSNPARIVIDKTIYESERVILSGSSALPAYALTPGVTFGLNEFAITRVFYRALTDTYNEYLINLDSRNEKAVTALSIANPVMLTIALPVIVPLQEVLIRFDSNLPDNNYITQNIIGPGSFEINYDNSAGVNVPPYGYVYTSTTAQYTHYKITNVTVANPAVVTISAHDYLAGDTVVLVSDVMNGEYPIVNVINSTQVTINYDNTLGGVAIIGTVDNRETYGGTLSRSAIQVFSPVIMTSVGHGLVTGSEIVISSADAYPSIDGRHVITVIDADTFSITNGNVINQVRGTTGNWIWGNQVVLHNLRSVPDINDIIYDITVLSDTQFSIPVVLEKVIDTNVNLTYWGTNVVCVQYNGHGLKAGDLISMYNVEDVGGIIAATMNTIHGAKIENVATTQEQLTRKRVSIDLILDTDPGSPTLGQFIPDPNNFIVYASGYHLTFKDILNGNVNSSKKSGNRLLDAFSKVSSVLGGGYDVLINCRDQTIYDLLNGYRNYGFADTQNNLLANGLLNRAIELDGENYLYILNGILAGVSSSSQVRDIFAKILLNSAPGSVVFNTFVSSIKNFNDAPLLKITELEFAFVDKYNNPYNFHGIDHSMTFEVSEYVDVISDTNISGRRGIEDKSGILYTTNCNDIDSQKSLL